MAPILGLLRSMAERGIDRKADLLLRGARPRRTCASKRSCARWRRRCRLPLRAGAVRAADDDDWDGEVGFITDVVRRREET